MAAAVSSNARTSYGRDRWRQGNEAILLRHRLTPAARSPYQDNWRRDPQLRANPGQHCTEDRKQDEYRHNDLPRSHDIDYASAKEIGNGASDAPEDEKASQNSRVTSNSAVENHSEISVNGEDPAQSDQCGREC